MLRCGISVGSAVIRRDRIWTFRGGGTACALPGEERTVSGNTKDFRCGRDPWSCKWNPGRAAYRSFRFLPCSEDRENSSCKTFFWGSFSGYSLFYPDLCYAGIFQGKRIKSSNQYFKDYAGDPAACRRPSGSRDVSGIWEKGICPVAK